jgi:SNF2 family DNA or RNA helicase
MTYHAEPYQVLMRDHLLTRERAGAFVGVGLGKTAATLDAINRLYQDGDCKAALVVAPLRVARLTWPNEIAKWDQFRWMRTEQLRGQQPSGKARIYLTNYEQLPNLRSLDFCSHVIFDELTRAKNPQSARIKAVRGLLHGQTRWGLTGTPRPNSLLELFAQIRLLDDGKRLSPSYSHFRNTYFSPIDYNEYNWEPKPHAEETIYRKILDLVITLRSSDYLDIPDTVVEDIELPLPKDAHAVYRELERELLVRLEGGDVVAPQAAILVNKLLQISGGTVYSEDRGVCVVHSGKLSALRRLLTDLAGERTIIATNYIHERERVVAAIPGAVDASKFEGDIEDAWNSGAISHLVADPRSLGHGLNLQGGGRTVIWFSPTWSRELYDQFNARVARKGQKQETRVYRIVCSSTMDEAVVESLREKGEGQAAMMSVLTNWRKLGTAFT